jgi:hypothetical protein
VDDVGPNVANGLAVVGSGIVATGISTTEGPIFVFWFSKNGA